MDPDMPLTKLTELLFAYNEPIVIKKASYQHRSKLC
jgi:hypothetical protein